MFIPTSVASMPIIRPGRAGHHAGRQVELAADHQQRDVTAGMPIVDATSVQLAMPSSFRNSSLWAEEDRDDDGAEQRADLRALEQLGEARSSPAARRSGCRRAGSDAGSSVVLIACPPPRASRPSAALLLVDEARAGEHGLAAADRVRVGLVELEEDDRQVALQVLLLVDREQRSSPALIALMTSPGEVERGELGLRAGALDRVMRGGRDVRVERHHARRSDLSAWSLDLISVCVVAMSSVPLTCRLVDLAAEALLDARRSAA